VLFIFLNYKQILYLNQIINCMLKVEVKKGNIEKSIKDLKSKVNKTKQNLILFERKEFVKKSIKKRLKLKRAIFNQKLKTFV
jgi:hypothetical protein